MSEMLQLRAWLIDTEPEIWRRLLVNPRLTLEQLHTVLQHTFGWTNSHMHQFHEKDGTRYARPTPMDDEFDFVAGGGSMGGRPRPRVIDERKVLLREVFNRRTKRIVYEYDFGDSWMHAVEFEGVVDGAAIEYPTETFVSRGRGVFSGKERAAVCLAGERGGPPEDCGGLAGFYDLLELKRHPPHPSARKDEEKREMLEWLGDWEEDLVDLAEINQMIGRVRVKKAHAG